MNVVVVGAGVAGAAAAVAAVRAGARATVVDGGASASALWTGKIDGTDPSDEQRAIAETLGARLVANESEILATVDGWFLRARGHERGLLSLPLDGDPRIGVVRCDRPGWDASIFEHDRFRAVEATILRHADERALPDADFAARHDDDARLAWLGARLREALAIANERFDALLLPPSLGADRARADDLAKIVGIPCGEAIALPGGPAGLRFQSARDRALEAAGVERLVGRATSVERTQRGWRVAIESDAHLDADAVVIATGGLVGGGIEYAPGEATFATALPPSARPPFRFTIDAPLSLGARGRPLDLPSSLFGIPPESLAWPSARDPLMDRVGALAASDGKVAEGLHVAGEVVADLPHTWLDALASGVRAGTAAAIASSAGATLPTRP